MIPSNLATRFYKSRSPPPRPTPKSAHTSKYFDYFANMIFSDRFPRADLSLSAILFPTFFIIDNAMAAVFPSSRWPWNEFSKAELIDTLATVLATPPRVEPDPQCHPPELEEAPSCDDQSGFAGKRPAGEVGFARCCLIVLNCVV